MNINDYITSGSISDAVDLATKRSPEMTFRDIDYYKMSEDAELYMKFALAYFDSASALQRVEIAEWVLGHSVAELAYLDAQAEAARLMSASVAGAIEYLASVLEQARTISGTPDAGLTQEEVQSYESAAGQIRGVHIPLTSTE